MDNLENVSDKLKIERLSDLVKSLYESIDDLKSQLDKENITQSNKAFAELYEKHRNLERNHNSSNEYVDEMESNINMLNDELDVRRGIIADKNRNIAELHEENWKLKESYIFNLADLANREELIKENEEKYNRLANLHVRQIQELEDSKSKLSQAEETIASYKKTYETLRKENETLVSKSKYDKETIDSYQKTYDTLRKELEASDNMQSSLCKIYDNLYDAYREYKLENEELKSALSKVIEANSNLIAKVPFHKEDVIIMYQNVLYWKRKVCEEMQLKLKESDDEHSDLNKMYAELYDNYNECKLENEELKNSLLNLFDYNSFLNKELSKVKNEKAILENNAAKHEKEVEHLSTIISGIENEIHEKMISFFILK